MKGKIIVVEDEVLIAMQIKSILEGQGYDVVINIYSVEAAIQQIEAETPLLVLIDISLNGYKDGIDLGRFLLEKGTIPYIYITSYSSKAILDRVNETRPNGYIVKPFKPSDLVATVSVVLNNFKHRDIDLVLAEGKAPDNVPFKMKMIVKYINDNIDKKIEVDDLIQLSKWKERHFSRLFHDYLKVSPYQYILSRKIEKAKSLIDETPTALKDIAFDLGFKSYGNFCNAFKKVNGNSPDDYRKKHKK